ncbi:50S ribosomal protein L29 [Candidatus Uhrbacteria bacterium]|nr:50S ribosomal protein L29 [Candidatus Uhrbacteria bacterium]
MDYAELKTKEPRELEELLRTTRDELRIARFSVRRSAEKDVRRLRELRTMIAQLLTALREKA